MNIPLSLPPNARTGIVSTSYKSRPSAFTNDYDNTTLQPHGSDESTFTAERALRERNRQSTTVARWKTQGPHLTSLTEEEFDRYLMNLVRQHKSEFRKFLEAVKMDKKRKHQEALMRDHADPNTFEVELQLRSRMEKGELDQWIKELRDNHHDLSSELSTLVREFFDLPAFPSASARQNNTNALANEIAVRTRNDAGPPSTHPSAGLSYLLTSAIVNNHPKYGPQSDREPVEARVLRTKEGNRSRDTKADVGLGGFVTSIQPGSIPGQSRFKDTGRGQREAPGPLHRLDLSLTGGNKVWLQPRSAYVDEEGRIRLDVGEASTQQVDIKMGKEIKEEQPAYSSINGSQMQRLDGGSFRPARYGTALPDERLRQQRPKPFERNDTDYKSGLEQIEALAKGTQGTQQ